MIELGIRGLGFWAPGVADWTQARDLLARGGDWPDIASGRPAPSLMPANERRRAPDSVLLALAVAEQACSDAAVDPASLPSVFASIYGDLAINDYMCATLRDDPSAMSPIRFHNSVHNAPSGYWSIATSARRPTSSVAAARDTFAAGLLETACQAVDGDGPVLLAAYDSAGSGPVAWTSFVSRSFGCALVIDPTTSAGPRLAIRTEPGDTTATAPRHARLAELAGGNPIAAGAAALFEAIGTNSSASIVLPLSAGMALHLELRQ